MHSLLLARFDACVFCCLVPADGEAVLYALSEQAANTEMGTKCSGGGDDVVLLNDQEEPTEVGKCCRAAAAPTPHKCMPLWQDGSLLQHVSSLECQEFPVLHFESCTASCVTCGLLLSLLLRRRSTTCGLCTPRTGRTSSSACLACLA